MACEGGVGVDDETCNLQRSGHQPTADDDRGTGSDVSRFESDEAVSDARQQYGEHDFPATIAASGPVVEFV